MDFCSYFVRIRPRTGSVKSRGAKMPGLPAPASPARDRTMNAPPTAGRDQGKPKLLDQVREALRARHYSIRTEQAYTQ